MREQGQDERHHGRVRHRPSARAPGPEQQREQAHAEHRARGAEQRPGHDVVVPGVGELVGHHRQRLVLRQALDEVVVDHHAPGAAEAGHVGVERRRTPGRVRHQHVVDPDALPVGQPQDLGAQRPVRQRLERVEQRLHHQRVDERGQQDEDGQQTRRDGRPGARPPAGAADQDDQPERQRHDADGLAAHLVGRETGPRLLGEPVLQQPALQQHGERQRHDPDGELHQGDRQQHPEPPRPGQPPGEAPAPGAEREPAGGGQGDRQRRPAQGPRTGRELLGAADLLGGEDRGGVRRRGNPTRHRVPGHQPGGQGDERDPPDPGHDEGHAARGRHAAKSDRLRRQARVSPPSVSPKVARSDEDSSRPPSTSR